jgi:ABC-type multidrug transport system ATPase subunit
LLYRTSLFLYFCSIAVKNINPAFSYHFDEPVNGLDPDGIAELRELLLHLNHASGMTILISSHILSELERVATCFGILHDRKTVKEVLSKTFFKTGLL